MQTFVIRDDQTRQRVIDRITALPLAVPMSVKIAPYKKSRSSEQNARYWSILTELAGQIGHTKDELHQFFSYKFLPLSGKEVMGHPLNTPISTTKLTVQQFTDYTTQIEVFALERGFHTGNDAY